MRKYLKTRLESLRPALTRPKMPSPSTRITAPRQSPFRQNQQNVQNGKSDNFDSANSVILSKSGIFSVPNAAPGQAFNVTESSRAKMQQPVLQQRITPFSGKMESRLVKPLFGTSHGLRLCSITPILQCPHNAKKCKLTAWGRVASFCTPEGF
jgi:hypothetical protein